MKILTLSFLTESKASHACLSSIRRVAITLLVMLLTTASAWAQEGPVIPTPKIYTKVTPENGGEINDAPTEAKMGTQVQFTVTPADGYKIKSVSLSDPGIYNLAGSLETGQYSFTIGSADVTIEVVFEEVLAVTFSANGGIGTMSPVIVGKGKQYTIPDCSFTNPNNQAFIGWSTSATGDVEYLPGNNVTINNNLLLYAVWDDYHLILNPNYDGGLDKNIIVSPLNPTYTLTSTDEPTLEGYAFAGWSGSPTSIVHYNTGDPVTLTGNLTLYAVWEKAYNLTLNPNYDGGLDKTIAVSSYTLSSADVPTREGHTFLGWSESPTSLFVQYNTRDEITLTDIFTLYAVWDYSLSYESIGETLELSGHTGNLPSILNIPATVTINGKEYSVTSIGNDTFWGCRSLNSVTIPNSVTSIGSNAFHQCYNLTSITIPNSVMSIGNSAFCWCENLKSITIPDGVTSIANSTFHGCGSLQAVTIPNSVTSIENGAFEGCYDLTSITIPNSVTTIGDDAFQDCINLQSVTINSNPKIGTDAFLGTPATVTMNLTASEIDGDYWTTFYNDNWEYNFEADGNTTVYKGTVNESSLVLTEVEDKIVNSGTAVILKSSGKPVMTLTGSGSSDTNDNDLRGISDRTKRTSVISNFSANEIYTMGNTSAGFGFHRYTGEYVPVGKAFLPLYIKNEAGAKAQSLIIVYANETTGINSVSSDSNEQSDWFTLDGTRLSGKPTQPGIYINGKKKIAIK